MMKIRYALLLSVSCLGLGSLANAGLIPDITPVGKNIFIFTQRGASAGESLLRVSRSSYTHLASQSKLLSASVIARRTLSDEAIHYNINGSPRGLLSARDDNSDTAYDREDYFFDLDVRVKPEHDIANFLSTHPVLPYQGKEHCGLSPVFPLLIERVRVSRSFPIPAQGARSAFHAPINQQQSTGSNGARLASVCFITDAGNCRDNDYTGANTPDNSSGGTPGGSSGGDESEDDWEVDNEEKCKKEGYTNEDCGEAATPGTSCLYDSSWHSGCICKPEYNKTCSGADEAGKGTSCNGKYKECCSLCSAYPYTDSTIPDGHIITASCQSCTETKYQTRCDTNTSNTGNYVNCGSATGSGKSCTDNSGTYYQKCSCPTDYEWNATSKKCVCSTSFKYTCNGNNSAGGDGKSCDNKYQKCKCASGFTWNASSGMCICNGTDWCTLNQNCQTLGYTQQSCSGQKLKCPFNTNYVLCF